MDPPRLAAHRRSPSAHRRFHGRPPRLLRKLLLFRALASSRPGVDRQHLLAGDGPVACLLWGRHWSGLSVLMHCDNTGVVGAWEKCWSRDRRQISLIRHTLFLAARYSFAPHVSHVPGTDNRKADTPPPLPLAGQPVPESPPSADAQVSRLPPMVRRSHTVLLVPP